MQIMVTKDNQSKAKVKGHQKIPQCCVRMPQDLSIV